MPEYDRRFSPPAPVLDVTVANPDTGVTMRLLGKIDTGADVTVIPEALAVRLGLVVQRHTWAGSYDGAITRRPNYYVQIKIGDAVMRLVRCVGVNRTTVLLGRNVLNEFVVILDGPNLTFEMKLP